MKIVVAYKWAPNPQDAVVDESGSVDWSRAKSNVSEYDPVAAQVARELADATGGEVIGLTVGAKDVDSAMARKAALSRGFDRAVIVADDSLEGAGVSRLAAVLAAAVRHIGDVDVVITGDSSVDIGAGMVPTVLAAQLDWPVLAEVTEIGADAAALRVVRNSVGGSEVLAVSTPAVLATSTDAAVPKIPGMKDIIAAAKKPVETLDVAALQIADEASTVRVTAASRPNLRARKGKIFTTTETTDAAAELVAALRGAGVL